MKSNVLGPLLKLSMVEALDESFELMSVLPFELILMNEEPQLKKWPMGPMNRIQRRVINDELIC